MAEGGGSEGRSSWRYRVTADQRISLSQWVRDGNGNNSLRGIRIENDIEILIQLHGASRHSVIHAAVKSGKGLIVVWLHHLFHRFASDCEYRLLHPTNYEQTERVSDIGFASKRYPNYTSWYLQNYFPPTFQECREHDSDAPGPWMLPGPSLTPPGRTVHLQKPHTHRWYERGRQ